MSKLGKILSAHQPNFLPWFGFFEKIIKSDVFVFSDDVAFTKQQLINRTYICNKKGEEFFVVLPVNRKSGIRIYEKLLSDDEKLIKKAINRITLNYANFKFIDEVHDICSKVIDDYKNNLSLGQINSNTILNICKHLDIESSFHFGSNLNLQQYKRNERLLKRSEKLKIMTYLHGKGATGYQDNLYLIKNGMKLKEIDYKITKAIFEEDYNLSIIHHIAKLGFKHIKNRIKRYKLSHYD